MKHPSKITIILVILFIVSQLIGLFIIHHYLGQALPLGIEAPAVDQDFSYLPLLIGIALATALALVLVKTEAVRVWKAWFALSIFVTLTIAFTVFVPQVAAAIIAAAIALWRIFRPNPYVHNFAELFIYGGLAAIFVPILNLWAALILFGVIAIYDMVAVWKTKHMVKMAQFQTKTKMFAGLLVQYGKPSTKKTKKKGENAILGGGDLGIPLIFAGVIMKDFGIWQAVIVVLFTAIALGLLFYFAKKKKFYPAIPFLLAGSLIGFGLSFLI
jgi:presenilin-like A22 family membrane protease